MAGMGLGEILNSGTQMASQFGGMALQNHYNKKAEKRQDTYQRGLADYQVMKQNDMNEQARKTNMKYWEDTNYSAQRKQMEKAGLNVGLMYGMGGGAGGTTGNAGGSAGQGSVQTHAPDAQGAMQGTGMAIMNTLQAEMMKAQIENVKADTQNKVEGTAGISADSKTKGLQANLTEETYEAQLNKIIGEARSAGSKGTVDRESIDYRIKQEELKAIQMGIEVKAKELGLELTEAEIKETEAKIQKIVAEIANMKDLTEAKQLEILQYKIQTEFNTSDPARIKQWTDIGTDVLKAVKGGTTINKTNTYERGAINNW